MFKRFFLEKISEIIPTGIPRGVYDLFQVETSDEFFVYFLIRILKESLEKLWSKKNAFTGIFKTFLALVDGFLEELLEELVKNILE